VAGSKTDPKMIYNIRSRREAPGCWLAERRGSRRPQFWTVRRKGIINSNGGRVLDSILRKEPDFEAVPVPYEWRVDYIPFNSKTDERLEKWFRSEPAARRFYMDLLKQKYPPKTQGIGEAQRPL